MIAKFTFQNGTVFGVQQRYHLSFIAHTHTQCVNCQIVVVHVTAVTFGNTIINISHRRNETISFIMISMAAYLTRLNCSRTLRLTAEKLFSTQAGTAGTDDFRKYGMYTNIQFNLRLGLKLNCFVRLYHSYSVFFFF